MLKNISWTNYIIAVTIALAIYYLFIGVRYYSGGIRDLVSGKRKLKSGAALPMAGSRYHENAEPGQQEADGFERTTDDAFNEVEHLVDRLKTVIADASGRKLIPQEFKQYLALVLKEYPSIKYSPLRPSVNELIISECEKYGAFALSEDEVNVLWKEAV